jgi:hypothetical protein
VGLAGSSKKPPIPPSVPFTADSVADAAQAGVPAQGPFWAVVIGITQYHPAITACDFGLPDARMIQTALVDRAGYDAERVLMLSDDQTKAHLVPSGMNLRNQLSGWLKRATAEDTVLVFYAGRAFVNSAQGRRLPERSRQSHRARPTDAPPKPR